MTGITDALARKDLIETKLKAFCSASAPSPSEDDVDFVHLEEGVGEADEEPAFSAVLVSPNRS